MADDFQAGRCSGSWWNAARSAGFDATAMAAASPLPSISVSGSSEALFTWSAIEMIEPNATACNDITVPTSSIAFQDTSPLMDSISGFSLSPSTMDWSHGLLTSGGKADTITSFHTMLQQDLNSRSLIQQDSSIVSEQPQTTTEALSMNIFKDMNQSLHLPSSGNVLTPTSYGCATTTMNCQPSMMMGFSEISSELSQPSWSDQFSSFVKPSPSKQQHPMDQSHLSNTAHFWNSCTSPSSASVDSSGFYPPIPSQFTAQTLSQKRSSYDVNMKSNFEGVRAANSCSTKKSSTSEPAMKKPRIEMPSPLPTFKVRKEKLGDRVTALQQLVSPFGKTDTASVLHETIEYIKFLHDQVRGLTAPYLKDGYSMHHQQSADELKDSEGQKPDLRSRGLCLVPITSTYPMASEIPADFWTPTIREIFSWNSGRADPGFPVMFQEDLSSGSYSQQGTSNNSNQIHTGVEGCWSEANLFKDMKQDFFDKQRLSSGDDIRRSINSNTIEPAMHDGYPSILIPGPFGTDTEPQQTVHNNRSTMHCQSLVSVIARA